QGAPRPASAAPPSAPAPLTARLSVNSTPYGTLYVDDVKIGVVPVFGHALSAGEHVIKVESERCKTKTEKIIVSDPNPIVRRYVLDCGVP
ncbi:MAG TPA: PEGA domain-containing protein, partial [Gemmatimonadales bacterium]|nr:PEGA domain-containing protein [Gemmatimonadales bacterium]